MEAPATETLSLTDEAVELALAWDRLQSVMDGEVLAYAVFDGTNWVVAAYREDQLGKSGSRPAFKEYEPTLPDAFNALAETLEELPAETDYDNDPVRRNN
jgi:hypothetical protein